jgi:hypothetical protein
MKGWLGDSRMRRAGMVRDEVTAYRAADGRDSMDGRSLPQRAVTNATLARSLFVYQCACEGVSAWDKPRSNKIPGKSRPVGKDGQNLREAYLADAGSACITDRFGSENPAAV